jgi:hypothetical protein
MSFLKSLRRCAKRAPMALGELEQQVETFLGCQIGVELIVSLVGSIKAQENPDDSFHHQSLPEARRAHQARVAASIGKQHPACRRQRLTTLNF